ncbi:MAG: hypothetical protein AAF085_02590 [Planctomycetota bacterium]
MHQSTSLSTGLILLTLLLSGVGCTNTQEVVDSWRGHPIEAVVDQWGMPGFYETVYGGHRHVSPLDYQFRTNSSEQPLQAGANTYTWEYVTHTFYPETCEVIEYKDGCKTVTKVRTIPAHWIRSSSHFYLTTNNAGLVNGGGSSREGLLWPLSLMPENRTGWGSLRRDWDPDHIDQVAAE